jgi:hypothetical protein
MAIRVLTNYVSARLRPLNNEKKYIKTFIPPTAEGALFDFQTRRAKLSFNVPVKYLLRREIYLISLAHALEYYYIFNIAL